MRPNQRVHIIYHKADFDGIASAALVHYECRAMDDVEFILHPYDYGDKDFDLRQLNQVADYVYIVDFSFPMEKMKAIQDIVGYNNFIWIDHHKTAIETYEKSGYRFQGITDTNYAACELAYFFNFDELPKLNSPIYLLGRYDIWQHYDTDYHDDAINLQYGLRTEKEAFNPCSDFWDDLIKSDVIQYELMKTGLLIRKYEQVQNMQYCEKYAFECLFHDLRFICVNKGQSNSMIFDDIFDPEKHDAMMVFCAFEEGGKLFDRVSMYTSKDIDLSEIAKKYNGGGHKKACGFVCDDIKQLVENKNKKLDDFNLI
jgi:oligoribonuclease NrnB/cAMP/cGMP phosphodiesterase (DHH superfamily)